MLLRCVGHVSHHGTCSSSPENCPEPVYRAAASPLCAAEADALAPGAGAGPGASNVLLERFGL